MAQGLMSRRLAGMGRMGDNELGHLTRGEVVVPEAVLNAGDTRQQLEEGFEEARAPMGRYIVGGMDDSINPRTGLREFWGVGDSDASGGIGGAGSDAGDFGGDDGGGGYSGPGPGEMGASPSRSFSASGTGAAAADTPSAPSRGRSAPSRATPGAGYHAATGHPGVSGLSPQAVELAARSPDARQGQHMDLPPLGPRAMFMDFISSIIDPERAEANRGLHQSQLEGWNRGRMETGQPHFAESGAWAADGLRGVLDPRGWSRAPAWANEARWSAGSDPAGDEPYRNGLMRPAAPARAAAPAPARSAYKPGVYTPPPTSTDVLRERWGRFMPTGAEA